jgi:broad specificity phosphatase PhoE
MGDLRTTVWLARHGETAWAAEDKFNGRGDIPLNDRGRAQAQKLAARLSREPLAAVYASSLRRCVETAALLAAPHGLAPVALDALAELDFGAWDGMQRQEIVARYPAAWAAWVADPATVAPPGGETAYAALGRARAALDQIVARHEGQTLLVVAHKAINRLLLCDLLGVMPRHYRARIGQRPCALNRIEWRDGGPMVALLNDVCHYE